MVHIKIICWGLARQFIRKRLPATKPDDLNLVSRTHRVEGDFLNCPLTSTRTWNTHMPPHYTPAHKINKIKSDAFFKIEFKIKKKHIKF